MRLVTYKLDPCGSKIAFVKVARKLLHLVMMENSGLCVKKVPLSEERFMTDLDYNMPKAAKRFRKFGKAHGSSKAARNLLKGV